MFRFVLNVMNNCMNRTSFTYAFVTERKKSEVCSLHYFCAIFHHLAWAYLFTFNNKKPKSCIAQEITSGTFWRLRRLSQSVRTDVTHRMRARTQITRHGCVQEVKNDINTVRFITQTARFVS